MNHRINHLHERALRIVYKDHIYDFGYLPAERNSVPNHVRNLSFNRYKKNNVRNLQLLKTEIFKTKFHQNLLFMKDIFQERNLNYSLRHGNDNQLPKVRPMSFGNEMIAYVGSRLRQLLP